ncbi:ABC transporter substrate-binding protein [Algoriphagus formosus]|uniref:ABC transporter substrate-binding protein n=1 Tax=Algoriphagus formosus TaxID=2007308 RepID=UPI003F71D71A
MNSLHLALDWTPNINHIGFFVAQAKGFYEKQGISLRISDPSTDNYQLTPAKKVELGKADFALCPTESLISYQTKEEAFPLKAIAAILQEDMSAIVVRKESNIHSPKDLDGKTYASYEARYEDGIVQQMIKNDGGKGNIKVTYPEKLGIWNTVLSGEYDSTWVFMNWEGVQVKSLGTALRSFRLADYHIPYSYSPVLACNGAQIEGKADAYRAFLKATAAGFQYAKENPEEAVKILQPLVPEHEQNIDLLKALTLPAPHFSKGETWGYMDPDRVSEFLSWLREKGLEQSQIPTGNLFSNELLDKEFKF